MEATGLDMLLDVHGDEEIPANFIGSMFGVPAWGPRLERLQAAYTGANGSSKLAATISSNICQTCVLRLMGICRTAAPCRAGRLQRNKFYVTGVLVFVPFNICCKRTEFQRLHK